MKGIAVKESAAYSAVERVSGSLHGEQHSYVFEYELQKS